MNEREPPSSLPDLQDIFKGTLDEDLSRDDLLNRNKIEALAASTVAHLIANFDTVWEKVPIEGVFKLGLRNVILVA